MPDVYSETILEGSISPHRKPHLNFDGWNWRKSEQITFASIPRIERYRSAIFGFGSTIRILFGFVAVREAANNLSPSVDAASVPGGV